MRTPTAQMIADAVNLVYGVDHVLANTRYESELSAKDCYDLAYKLEQAMSCLLAVGNRKAQEAITADEVEVF